MRDSQKSFKTSIGTADLPAEIRTTDLRNTKESSYHVDGGDVTTAARLMETVGFIKIAFCELISFIDEATDPLTKRSGVKSAEACSWSLTFI